MATDTRRAKAPRAAPQVTTRAAILAGLLAATPLAASAQAIDLSHGGPVTVTAAGGIDWDQNAQTVTAHEDARATRGNATVVADRLIAHYRKKTTPPGTAGKATAAKLTAAKPAKPAAPAAPASPAAAPISATTPGAPADPNAPPAPATAGDTGGNEIYRLDADGKVHIFTQTDQAWGDHAVYDIDQAVMVLTGHGLKLTTPQDVLTARDAMEYWSVKRMAIGRGDAVVTSNDGRRITADTLVGYTVDPNAPGPDGKPAPPPPKPKPGKQPDALGASGKLQRVEAFGHVQVRTATEIVTGDRGVYVPDTGLARIVGHVHITRGDNQLNGAAAIVNMKTGLATLTQAPGGRVQGLVVPNGSDAAKTDPTKPDAPTKTKTTKKPAPTPSGKKAKARSNS